MGCDVRRRVETQPSNDCVGVTVARVDGNPFAAAALAVLAKFRRADRRFQQTGAAERVRNRARTIVAPIDERFVAAAENVRLAEKLICRPDRSFNGDRRGDGSRSLPAPKFGAISRDSGAKRGKRIRVSG